MDMFVSCDVIIARTSKWSWAWRFLQRINWS